MRDMLVSVSFSPLIVVLAWIAIRCLAFSVMAVYYHKERVAFVLKALDEEWLDADGLHEKLENTPYRLPRWGLQIWIDSLVRSNVIVPYENGARPTGLYRLPA